MINFTPRKAPLKEGRSYPGLPHPGPSGRGLKSRQGMLIVLVLICLPLGIYYMNGGFDSSSSVLSRSGLETKAESLFAPKANIGPNGGQVVAPHMNPAPDAEGSKGEKQAPFKAPPASEDIPSKPQAPKKATDEEPARQAADIPAQPKGYSSKTTTDGKSMSASLERWSERPKFEKNLARVVNMLPGEIHMRDLLRGVEGTGKEKLREMGLRTRAYKGFFEAWEDLHLDYDEEGGISVRDDVIQYLRSHDHSESASITGLTDMGLAQIARAYESYRYFLAKFGQLLFPWTAPYFSDHMSLHAHFKRGGRGIVLTAGDDQAPYLLTTIPIFRQLGCNLPIEVMYLGDTDLSEDFRSDLEAMDGVITRDIAQMVNDEGWKLAGWAAKPFAILLSSFREVIFIDADSLFFRNPEVLFDDPDYKETGALFFKDRLIMPESKKRWLQQILPKPISKAVKQSRFWTGDSGHMQESGVVVVDKWRHFIALMLVTRMNGPDRDGNKDEGRIGIYDMVYGDKETFWIGWELVGDMAYSFHGGDAGIMGKLKENRHKPEESTTAENKDGEKDKEKEKEKKPKKPKKEKKVGEVWGEGEKIGEEHKEGEADAAAATTEEEDKPEAEAQTPVLNEADLPIDNYTICSPQLLHLDLEGRPLWFNGWLLDNKFADKRSRKFGSFDHYLIEPRDVRDPGSWQLEEANMCCLTSDVDKKFDFTSEERSTLEMIMKKAREVGAPGSEQHRSKRR